MNITYARQGTVNRPIMWAICWEGPGWYAGADGQTVRLDSTDLLSASQEARQRGLGTATPHENEASLVAAHGNNW